MNKQIIPYIQCFQKSFYALEVRGALFTRLSLVCVTGLHYQTCIDEHSHGGDTMSITTFIYITLIMMHVVHWKNAKQKKKNRNLY